MKAFIKPLAFVTGIFIFLSASAQNSDSLWMRLNYYKVEKEISMRDGVKLFTAVYIPNDTLENHPILITRSPYSCDPYGENNFTEYWNSYQMAYLKEKFIMVTQDVRGRWMSEGDFVDVRPFIAHKRGNETDEASDTYDAIDWLIKNIPHNTGKAGVVGISYPGFYSTMSAASNHPALVAVSPQAPVTNWFIGDDFHHNGVLFEMDAFSFYIGGGFGKPHPKPTMTGPEGFNYYTHDNYKFYLETGALKNLARLAGDSIKFWKDLYSHPNYDSWWQARDARNATKTLRPAMLWVGGEYDAEDNWGAWNSYLAAEKNNPGKDFNRLVMGPWYHGQWSSHDGTHMGHINFGSNTSTWYQQNIEIPFFKYYLEGNGDVSKIAEATVFISGSNEWRQFSQWPPEGTKDTPIYLQDNGRLTWNHPSVDKSFSEYTSDPARPVPYAEGVHFNRTREYMDDDQRFAERRPDVLTFTTDILTKDVTVTGNVIASLYTAISTTDADFAIKLIDVFPDSLSYNNVNIYAENEGAGPYPMGGYEMLVHAEIFRGRYRNSYEKPEAFVPGKVTNVRFSVANVAHTFKQGHRIMVQIQSTWFPLADRNPQQFVDIYHCNDSDFIKSDIRIYHDKTNPSQLILPVLGK